MKIFRLGLYGPALVVAGCAIHPLPENVTGLTTPQIVKQIRCETRQAIIDSALGWLTKQNDDKEAKAIAIDFDANRDKISTFKPSLFKGRVRKILEKFWDAGVAYNYTLRMTENNNLDTSVNLLKPFTNGTFPLGLSAKFDRQRQNERTFTTTDTFNNLIQKVSNNYCDGKIVGENAVYPIAGRIGVDSVVHDFVNLTLFEGLSAEKDKPKGPPTLVDSLDFETVVSGSVIPKVTFAPVGSAFRVADATLTGTATRTDVHQVVIGLSIAEVDTPKAKASGHASATPHTLVGSLLTASGIPSEQAAALAVDQVLTRQLFKPTIVLDNQ